MAWRRHVEAVAAINDWDDNRTMLEVQAGLEGQAANVTGHIDINDFPNAHALLEAVEEIFLPAAQSQLALGAFEVAQQVEGEPVMEWHARIRELFMRAYPGEDPNGSRNLTKTFSLGLAAEDVQEWVWEMQPNTFQEALVLANNKAAAMAMVAQARTARSSGKSQLAKQQFKLSALTGQPSQGKGSFVKGGPRTCFFCKEAGHFQRECPLLKKAVKYVQNSAHLRRAFDNSGGKDKDDFREKKVLASLEVEEDLALEYDGAGEEQGTPVRAGN
jgi:hypothetical protein